MQKKIHIVSLFKTFKLSTSIKNPDRRGPGPQYRPLTDDDTPLHGFKHRSTADYLRNYRSTVGTCSALLTNDNTPLHGFKHRPTADYLRNYCSTVGTCIARLTTDDTPRHGCQHRPETTDRR